MSAVGAPPRSCRGGRGARGRGTGRPYGVATAGAYSSTTAWWSREHWRSELLADLSTAEVDVLRRSVGTRGPVSVRAIYAVAVAISATADGDTGRNAMPGNTALTARGDELDEDDAGYWARLAASSGYQLTTVQKAVQVLTVRGWLVLVRAGKNYLTRDERTEIWRSGASARARRNVWACTLPAHVRRPGDGEAGRRGSGRPPGDETVDNGASAEWPEEPGCDLPTPRRGTWTPHVPATNNLNPEQATRTAATRRAPTPGRPPDRTYRIDRRVVWLAAELRGRIPWLARVPLRRITPALHRYAVSGWSAHEVQAHLDRLLGERGWAVPGSPAETLRDAYGGTHRRPATTMRSPWGYLAFLLRQLDPSDLTVERAHRAELAAREEYQRQLVVGPVCPHGQPGGDVPSPTRGVLACPWCRHERAARG